MKRVLVVEDDDAIALVLQDLLESESFEVQRAVDGRTGLEMLSTFQPHVILLDLMMPVMDGWAFRAQQRAMDPALASIPVVVLSGTRDARAAATELQAAAVVVKPFLLDALIDAIRRAL